MTWNEWWFLALIVVTVLALVASKLELFSERMRERTPNFYWNYVGGVLAVCSYGDYHRARKAQRGWKLVRVPETVMFSNKDLSEYVQFSDVGPTCQSPVARDNLTPFNHPCFQQTRLFVPFASESEMTYAEQAAFFTWRIGSWEELVHFRSDRFSDQSRRNLTKRMQALLYWFKERKIFRSVQIYSLGSALIFALMLLVGIIRQMREERLAAPKTYHTTTLNSSEVATFQGTRREVAQRVVSSYGGVVIYQGRIETIDNIGGGMRSLCMVRTSDGLLVCSLADSALDARKGNTGYIRIGRLRFSADVEKDGSIKAVDHGRILWAISEPEALALKRLGARIQK